MYLIRNTENRTCKSCGGIHTFYTKGCKYIAIPSHWFEDHNLPGLGGGLGGEPVKITMAYKMFYNINWDLKYHERITSRYWEKI